ncbi:acyltransferase [Pseudonocardia ailaonensis]|uniref:Acyltransferase n=1 Tax=Pseudonocardia ailaonensis TaxID=367279 RepID=A0ABN2NKT2_9PSEU
MSRKVRQAEMVRVLTFACVIAVHTLSTTQPLDGVTPNAVVMLLHFTREAFFVLTAFVLTVRHLDRGPRPVPFWKRRFLLVGVPYVVWTLIYTGLQWATAAPASAGQALADLGINLGTGVGWFHLYFLLVSLQFYLLFPLFRRLMRATHGHHLLLLAASFLLQIGIDLVLHDPAPTGLKAVLLPYAGSFVLSYQFFLVLGGVVAMHLDAVVAWVRRLPWVVAAVVVVSGAGAELWYLRSVAAGQPAAFAADVFQPVMIVWSVAVVAGFFTLGTVWRVPRVIDLASERSFGVFLVHPAILWALTVAGTVLALPSPWSSVVAYLAAVAGSLLVVEILRRTPLSLPLTGKGRPRTPETRRPPLRVGALRREGGMT